MNNSGEIADLLVKESLQVTDEVVKLTGLGAKNLAAIVLALIKDDTKLHGRTGLRQLIKADKPLCILPLPEQSLNAFAKLAKKYGVLFTAVSDKNNDTGICDIIAKQDDVATLNYIMEKLGIAVPEQAAEDVKESDAAKKAMPRERKKENRQEHESMKRGDTEKTGRNTDGKPSVKRKIESFKKEIAGRKDRHEEEITLPKRRKVKQKGKEL